MTEIKSLFILSLFVSVSLARLMACTNFLATKGATKDGSTIITYAADSHGLYGDLVFYPAADHAAGQTIKLYEGGKLMCEVAQVPHTYNVVGYVNEHQVAIGESTFDGRPELAGVDGLNYVTMFHLALQRAKTAREAIKIMAELMDTYGYRSTGESFSICDPNEVWIMEVIGKGRAEFDTLKGQRVLKKGYKDFKEGAVWVALRVPEGYVTGHANQARITTFPQETRGSRRSISSRNMKYLYDDEVECVYAADVISLARLRGYYNGKDEDFSFADAYCPLTFVGMRGCDARVYAMFSTLKKGIREQYADYALGRNPKNRLPLWIHPDHKIDVYDVMNVMRNHYEDTPLDMRYDIGAGPFGCPYRWRPMHYEVDGKMYMHERPISTQQTGFCAIAQCRGWLPNNIGGMLWFGVDDTYSTVFSPLYCSQSVIPECFRQGNGSMTEYSETAAFWLFNRVANFAYGRYRDMILDIQQAQREMETGFIKAVAEQDKRLSGLSEAEVTSLNNEFSARMAQQMMVRWKKLDQFLLMRYMDGTVRRVADDGNLDPQNFDLPGYPQWFNGKIVEDQGEKNLEYEVGKEPTIF
ncbi:MAG: C69 family dipeptidase [Bacteroidales bacterium]|nr:C69 family dipeptidase [Bacteroidales bacterium]